MFNSIRGRLRSDGEDKDRRAGEIASDRISPLPWNRT